MPKWDTQIARSDVRAARKFQLLFPLMFKLRHSNSALEFATKKIMRPERIGVPTRHGNVRTYVYSPPAADLAELARLGKRPPVHLLVHGGAFVIRSPWHEGSVARFLASEVGCVVLVPDYDTAPMVRWPVAEEQNTDVYRWLLNNGQAHGWDTSKITIGGASAGSKIAMSVVAQAIEDGDPLPTAVTSEFGCCDLSRPDEGRTTPLARPIVGKEMIRLARATYFLGADMHDPRVSVALHPRLGEFPPTLIMTGEYDTLSHEMNDMAKDMTGRGVRVTHRQFPGVDHGFTHNRPLSIAREAVFMIGDHLKAAHQRVDEAS